MKTKNLMIYPNICFIMAIVVCDLVFMFGNVDPYIIKTLTSALFVLMGAFNLALALYFFKGKESLKCICLFVGLVFAFVGDVLLIDHFMYGAIFFAVGHICFLIYFILLQGVSWQDGLLFVLISVFALLLIFLYKGFKFKGDQALVIAYAVVISLMLAKALGNLVTKPTTLNLVLFVGAFLFFFSDLMLMFDLYTNISPVFDYLCLATYYPGETLLALSPLLINFKDTPLKSAKVNDENGQPKADKKITEQPTVKEEEKPEKQEKVKEIEKPKQQGTSKTRKTAKKTSSKSKK